MSIKQIIVLFSLILLLLGVWAVGSCQNRSDDDHDEIYADVDNCPQIYNPSQQDSDQDGLGDPCDEESPLFDTSLAECYIVNFSDLRGEYWKDAAMWLYVDYQGTKWVILYWQHGYPEYGWQYDNQRDIWAMLYNDQLPEWSGTWFEALASTVGPDGVVDTLTGPAIMLECSNCSSTSQIWSVGYQGTMTAVRTDRSYCTGE